MSYLHHSLELLHFRSIEDVTSESLKKAFKKTILTAHPDKGGSEQSFDELLGAYVYLTETLNRLSGGRSALQCVISPEELQGQRANQLINEVFQELDNEQMNEQLQKMRLEHDTFHKKFEEQLEENKGYLSWFTSTDGADQLMEDAEGIYGIHTIKRPAFSEAELHQQFETAVRMGKAEPTSIMLHPDEMAYRSGTCLGVALMEEAGGTFTSDPNVNPEYTDLYSAYTSDNTMYDKLPTFKDVPKSLEDLIKERDAIYTCQKDEDLEVIAAYEKKKMEQEAAHKKRMTDYFNGTASSVWAIKDTNAVMSNEASFIKQL